MKLQRGNTAPARSFISFARLLIIGQALGLVLSPIFPLSAIAQAPPPGINADVVRPQTVTPSTILPTDVLPLPAAQERMSFGENMQLRLLQRLPASLYINTSVESSFRYETNVFQFPHKRQLLQQLVPAGFTESNGQGILSGPLLETTNPAGSFGRVIKFANQPPQYVAFPVVAPSNQLSQVTLSQTVALADREDVIFRVLPNVTVGWALTPRTRVFGNYFMIRDSLFNNVRLNTVIQSVAYGIQQDIPVTRKGNLQLEMQFRELFQLKQQPVFDFLPAATFSYILTPRTVAFVNALLQMRGKKYFQAPTKELDPFYTFGFLYQRGGWSLSTTATFVQNFREPFRHNASTPINNYSWILDFELARRILREIPGLQAFVRAEPIYNFHSGQRPGLGGQDFRLFYGLRMALGKPPLKQALEQIRQQLEEQETAPPGTQPPGKTPGEPKPSAYLQPYQLTAERPQPIHGPISLVSMKEERLTKPTTQKGPAIAKAAPAATKPPVVAKAKPAAKKIETKEATAHAAKPKPAIAELPKPAAEPAKAAPVKIAAKKEAPKTPVKKELEMILIPPLPTVHLDNKNPFRESGVDVSRPVMVTR